MFFYAVHGEKYRIDVEIFAALCYTVTILSDWNDTL